MKKIVQISTLSLVLLNCGAINRNLFGATESDLIKTVAIDQGCPAENIKILESQKGAYGATYSLDVCGKKMIYKQWGTAFVEASKAEEAMKNMKK
ncbi:hypothetical protein CMT57_01565 [Elizabethkingia anophelis]|uniref:hypothetical protein n=1 Tax=Elizabethkingia anophelis TaxID=1117645 RepID=UPI002012CEEF|nr:hypothetical protein [Elizabethkingia anophelis]MCL1691625.1 hypothetical protein [Elizabethkingia anophelis]MDV4008524.1 hypothetical protein [Elizabethkingia anophelis]